MAISEARMRFIRQMATSAHEGWRESHPQQPDVRVVLDMVLASDERLFDTIAPSDLGGATLGAALVALLVEFDNQRIRLSEVEAQLAAARRAPVTDAQLDEMQRRNDQGIGLAESDDCLRAYDDRAVLLHEVRHRRIENQRLMALLDAARPVVQAVAEADNSDNSVCYQICNVRWYNGETDAEELDMRHDAPCVVERAEAVWAQMKGTEGGTDGDS